MQVPSDSAWEVSADVPGFWVRRETVSTGPADQVTRLALTLWPLGKISGVLTVKDKKIPLPKMLVVQTVGAPAFAKRPEAPKGALDCPVDEHGQWSCSLPATTYDLVISAKGMTPHYRWHVQVPAGKTLALGTVELERGASVAGWVAVEGGAIEEGCVARLSPLVAGGADLKSVSELGRTAREQPVRKDGFLQLTGLAPGNYLIEVEQPGYPPVRVSPVKVDHGTETFLRAPILLRKPIELRFDIHPPADWLGKAWGAQVVRRADRPPSPIIFDGTVAETGRLTVPDQSAGRFRVTIKDSLGNKL
ncbi:MAG TPA: carboxypeptidase-like regulatory domain-containing protein, partial [Thermoanaerobaculia bacterium]